MTSDQVRVDNLPLTIEDFQAEISLLTSQTNAPKNAGLFLVKTANQWIESAKVRPIPQMLFAQFWYEGELCILFSDTNLGKSILAVQIGNSIARGEQIPGFAFEAQRQSILYFDFELSDKQFEARYSINFKEHYSWNDNFHRAEIDPDVALPEGYASFEDYLNVSLENCIIETGARVLIIDNITYLKTETERAKDALPLMKHLKRLKNKYGLSILALAHTPKRDLTKPISRNDLMGSKMLINFCDSSFAIGESNNDKEVRYLKQIKARNTEIIYDTENVILCQVRKPVNFLQFDYIGFGIEREHLRKMSVEDAEGLNQQIIELHKQGLSYRDIGIQLGISHMKVSRVMKKTL
jgi:hypothetical protein